MYLCVMKHAAVVRYEEGLIHCLKVKMLKKRHKEKCFLFEGVYTAAPAAAFRTHPQHLPAHLVCPPAFGLLWMSYFT